MSENKLLVLAEQSGIEKTRAQEVLDTFQPFFQKAAEWGKTRIEALRNLENNPK
jgi:hypothetical protein